MAKSGYELGCAVHKKCEIREWRVSKRGKHVYSTWFMHLFGKFWNLSSGNALFWTVFPLKNGQNRLYSRVSCSQKKVKSGNGGCRKERTWIWSLMRGFSCKKKNIFLSTCIYIKVSYCSSCYFCRSFCWAPLFTLWRKRAAFHYLLKRWQPVADPGFGQGGGQGGKQDPRTRWRALRLWWALHVLEGLV